MSTLADLLGPYSAATITWLAAIAFVASLARGFSSFGAGLIFVPLASALVSPRVAVPLFLLIDAVGTAPHVPRAWSEANRREVAFMATGALAAVPTGAWLLARTDPVPIRWGVSALCLTMLVLLVSGWRYRGTPTPPLSIAAGAGAGLLNGIAQVGGPVTIAYWLGGQSDSRTIRANMIVFFALSTLVTFVSYFTGGLLTAAVLALSLLTALPYAVGFALGTRLYGFASETTFRRVCYGLILAAALLAMPVFDGLFR